LIEKIRPRFITVEQTFGIKNFHDYFSSLKRFFIKHGYSLRWRMVFFSGYGLPQRRQRLIMIGACPGEVLPPFPPATHADGGDGGLKPFATIRDVLEGLDVEPRLHEPSRMKSFSKAPYSADQILAKCITTGGGHNHHYSGKRNYTLREYACLQGFPRQHEFQGSCIKKQVGNAFPPCVVQTIYEYLQKEMLKQDSLLPARKRVINIDDDEDENNNDRRGGIVTQTQAIHLGNDHVSRDAGIYADPDVMELDVEITSNYTATLVGYPVSIVIDD
jgi:DNA (cytosine-5)-methyltransferase 1